VIPKLHEEEPSVITCGQLQPKLFLRTRPSATKHSPNSEDEDNLLTLFANLNMQQKENKKHVKVKNAHAQEVEKNENLTKELSICHDTISNLRTENASLNAKVEKLNACNGSIVNLRNENASLIAKIDKLNESISSLKNENASLISKARDLNVCNDSISYLRYENAMLKSKIDELNICKPSTSTVDHVTICTTCRDVNVDAIHDHLALIKQQNDHIAQLTTKINEHEVENEKFKFARSMLYNGRRPGIKDGIGFQQGSNVKLNAPKKLSSFVKGKAPMV
jgi:predicted nuclease with TOPRIM domain